MKTCTNLQRLKPQLWTAVLVAAWLVLLPNSQAGFTVNVVDSVGHPVDGFYWLVELDTTYDVVPDDPVVNTLSVELHKSHAPTLRQGETRGSSVDIDLPTTERYFVSVLPKDGRFTMGGGQVRVAQETLTVTVHAYPLPTAQISILAFHDNHPLNNEPDLPAERGLAGFDVTIADAAGMMTLDAFGNMLGTTYQVDAAGNPILDEDGNPMVNMMGTGVIKTDANGEAQIKYIPQGKFGIVLVPPPGQGWVQTATIEGTETIDAWVQAGEPEFMIEFSPGFHHVFVGFIQPTDRLAELSDGGQPRGSITGRLVNNHLSKPPVVLGYPGAPLPDGWIGLNSLVTLEALYAAPCQADGTFTITNVPPGTYQIVAWDLNLDYIFQFSTITVAEGEALDLGDYRVFRWFGELHGSVFYDANENGFRDPGEMGMGSQDLALRFRSGAVYQATATDMMGHYSFSEIFPFFKYLVMEVGFLRYKATGATFVVDTGGEIPPHDGWTMPSFGFLNPQVQAEYNPNTGNYLARTELGQVLVEAFSLQLGQGIYADWGKSNYAPGENGGISGVVYYATTRAEDDPRYGAPEPWEPGIPNIQVNLYADFNSDQVIDDVNGDGVVTLADVDNYPIGDFPEAEDVDWDHDGMFDPGDALNFTYTDSWDENEPDDCPGEPLIVHGGVVRDCFDNFGTWNQVRPGVFDGGYAFMSYYPGGIESGSVETDYLPEATYIVEAAVPPGLSLVKEEDKNVDFGDGYLPDTLALPPVCCGDPHEIPPELSLFPGVETAFSGQTRPSCNRKQIAVTRSVNAALDFFMFTMTPKAARAVGFINNDLGAEFSTASPIRGEKSAPRWIPVSFRDHTGREVVRTYCDEFGSYNALLPSNYTNNLGTPSGNTPQMYRIALNHPGPIPDPDHEGQFITDPQFDPGFSQTNWTMNFSSGLTTYLDTPVVPIGAFQEIAGTLDCEYPNGTPMILSVNGPIGGPYVSAIGDIITITSLGIRSVPNPNYDPNRPDGQPRTSRDYSFGTIPGSVTIGGVPLVNIVWAADGLTIQAEIPPGATTGQLKITRGDNEISSQLAVTVQIGGGVVTVNPGESIQAAINSASDGDVILLAPGHYRENLILWKNVKLQGAGAFSTIIDGGSIVDLPKQASWQAFAHSLVDDGHVDLVSGQDAAQLFSTNMGPTVMVMVADGLFSAGNAASIDGLTLVSSVFGSGIFVNGYGRYMTITNNRILSNQGTYGGGIVLGQPSLVENPCDPFCGSGNEAIRIHSNQITKNSGIFGAGGIAIHNGADGYEVSGNLICGNFSMNNGGGIGHYGLSTDGFIYHNHILFNEVFYGGNADGSGGGIYLASDNIPGANGLKPGVGNVTIDANVIQGNLAASGVGGGVYLNGVNGDDVAASPNHPSDWYEVKFFNNLIVNNAAGYLGGAIALQDSARIKIIHNTIVANDSTATAANAFVNQGVGGLFVSTPQIAGIASFAHSPALLSAIGSGGSIAHSAFSNPLLFDTIIYRNRSYYWDSSLNQGLGELLLNPVETVWDMGVIGTTLPMTLSPMNCLLTDTTGYDPSNIESKPMFAASYTNDYLGAMIFDEGGNAISIIFNPLTSAAGDYHLRATSPAIDSGSGKFTDQYPELARDLDHDLRTQGTADDIGADEFIIWTTTTLEPKDVNSQAADGDWGKTKENPGLAPVDSTW